MDSDLEHESKLISLICQQVFIHQDFDSDPNWDWKSNAISLIVQIISLVNSMDLDSQPKSELTSLISQTISVFSFMDLDSQPKPLLEIISLIKPTISLFKSLDMYLEPRPLSKLESLITQESSLLNSVDSDWEFRLPDYDQTFSLQFKPKSDLDFRVLVHQTFLLEPEPELMSLIHQIVFLALSMNPEWKNLISVCPQVKVRFEEGKFLVKGEIKRGNKWKCLPSNWDKFRLTREDEDDTHFLCKGCKGENHEEYEKVLVEIEHPLHPKHPLQLVLLSSQYGKTRNCYCCDEDLMTVFYYCSVCDFAMNIACMEKQPVLSIESPKWHEHTLTHFSSQAPSTCDVCALVDPSSPIYSCHPCNFVVHQSCTSLPRVLRISRHLHRLYFTPAFDQGDWSCGVCRKNIDNDYGGYSCIKEGCSYVAHSKCATQSNVWDGKDLEGEPEQIEEVLEPFVRISDGIIQHFSHQHHHLRLDEDINRDYDDNKQCQACLTPIYFGNLYSCMQCDFILHEECANLSRKIHHPVHPHSLTLMGGYDGVIDYDDGKCSLCLRMCTAGFFYECGEEGCDFKLNVQCATISEPLVHQSHKHPLFLTANPRRGRLCSVSKDSRKKKETFNCIECEFYMCFRCATLPQKVRYKHDKHMLSLSYGEETSNMSYWCEVCEGKVNPKEGFYKCDEYCCVTLHIRCLIGEDYYMKPGSSYNRDGNKVDILPNNHHMSRPICSDCEMRCPEKIVFQFSGSIFCSVFCTY